MKVYDFAFDDEPTEVDESELKREDEFAPQECSICGQVLGKRIKFCPYCGEEVKWVGRETVARRMVKRVDEGGDMNVDAKGA